MVRVGPFISSYLVRPDHLCTRTKYFITGHQVTIYTDHATVKAVLGTSNLTSKHACWWSKIHGSGIGEVDIVHRAGKENLHADALSHQPVMPAPTDEDSTIEVQVTKVYSAKVPGTLHELLEQHPTSAITDSDTLSSHQLSDPDLCPIILYLKENSLPEHNQKTQQVVTLAQQFTMSDEVLN